MDSVLENDATGPAHSAEPGFLAQAWLVLLLAIGFGAALAFVQVRLGGVIAANKLNETLTRVPELVWGAEAAQYEADKAHPVRITPGALAVEKKEKTTHYALFRVDRGEELAGWVVKAGGQGYADRIEALIGLSPDAAAITGLFILEQKETPGLGNKVTFAPWRDQFNGKSTATPLAVTKTRSDAANAIDAVTGATISSRSVTDIVNRTVGDLRGRLNPETLQPKTGGEQ